MRLNPNAVAEFRQVGDFPVLVLDDVYEDVEEVRERALRARYDTAAAYYPGLHAPLAGDPDTQAFTAILCRLLASAGRMRYDPREVAVDFSVITVPPHKLLAEQQHPHIDPTPLFALIYLTPGIQTATSFYRNTVTGLHKIITDDDRKRHGEFIAAHGTERLEGDYDISQSPYWECIHSLDGKYNRLVSYPGNVFHAVMPGPVPDPFDIEKARITQRFSFREVGGAPHGG